MTSSTTQRDLMLSLKRETIFNVELLSKLQPLPSELSRMNFKEALEKPTQSLFNHLSYYLVGIVDPQRASNFSWPLYDTTLERTYRNQLSSFLADYSKKGLLSPVMSSYLVNPGCYKVTLVTFQLSQLAIEKMLKSKMIKNTQQMLYKDMTEKYKSQDEEFLDKIENETSIMIGKFSDFLSKKKVMEQIAEMLHKKINDMNNTLLMSGGQEIINELVDSFVEKHSLNEDIKVKILALKDINAPAEILDEWLTILDTKIDEMERKWAEKTAPFLQVCKITADNTEAVVARHTGQADKKSYTIEFDPKMDHINTRDLENQVNSEQKYILKNIVKDGRLSFPNLVRGAAISICYMLKETNFEDGIYEFNEYLNEGCVRYKAIVSAMKELNERVLNTEAKLQPSPLNYHHPAVINDCDISPLPDLSDLKTSKELHCQVLFDSFTPLNTTKHQFNLRKQKDSNKFIKPYSKSLLVTPFHQAPRDDFFKSLKSHPVDYFNADSSKNINDISIISQINRGSEPKAESSGFTREQIFRLVSTKKSSSSKKQRKTERPSINVRKGGLINELNVFNESTSLFRSYSSPNLYENTDQRCLGRQRKLSIMHEDNQSLLEVSGIAALEENSRCGTPRRANLESTRKLIDTSSLPFIIIQSEDGSKINDLFKDLNQEINGKPEKINTPESKSETPNDTKITKKTNSIEKIINRFMKVRANVVSKNNDSKEIRTIAEEKENFNSVNLDVFTANRVLLPDLLSPNCSVQTVKSKDYLAQLDIEIEDKIGRKPRESLGTALGVDESFLDQFDLID